MSYATSILRTYSSSPAVRSAGEPPGWVSVPVYYGLGAGMLAIGALGAYIGITKHPTSPWIYGGLYGAGAMVAVPAIAVLTSKIVASAESASTTTLAVRNP